MIRKTIRDLAAMAGGVLIQDTGAVVKGAVTDSRQVVPGSLYVPVIGARVDGHDFIAQAVQAGAAAALWQKDHTPLPADVPLILVEDTVQALQNIARAYLHELHPYTIGITGSNGKTSAKDMMKAVFSRHFVTQATPGNRNSEIGLPLTILEFDPEIEAAVLEMGMENFGEIETLVDIAPLDAAVITSIGSAHMENLGSKQGIAQAKMEILRGLRPGGTFLYLADAPELAMELQKPETHRFIEENDITVIPFSHRDLHHVSVEQGRMAFEWNGTPWRLNALGSFQCVNALPALILGETRGISSADRHQALETLVMTGMRTALQPAGRAHVLDDSYKSNPESAIAALDTLASLPGSHYAVLGDMLDLGPQEMELHRRVLDHARTLGIEVFTTGPVFGRIGESWHEDQDGLFEAVKPLLEEDAVILVKGSRALQLDKLAGRLEKEGNELMKKIKLAVLFGGQSSEYSVSLHSVASLLRNLNRDKYDLSLVGITKEGRFLEYTGDIDHIEHDTWNTPELTTPVAWVHGGYVRPESDVPAAVRALDTVFPVLHGKNGEDGTLQGLMEIMNIHCVGCDTLSSAMIMDKDITHIVLDAQGIPTAKYVCLKAGIPYSAEEILQVIPLPWIVKPCNAGSSYGVHKVDTLAEFDEAAKDAFHWDGRGKILVEECIPGFEIGCAVMGNLEPFAGDVDEIEIHGGFFDFAGKYEMKDSAIYCPARISPEKTEEARALAVAAYQAMGCSGFTRVDMFLQPDGALVINELNTVPGMTATSRYPTMMEKAGLPFAKLLDDLIALSLEKEVGQC